MQEFYAAIRQSWAVLPAFAGDHYYCCKASSTVPAALIAGTPLLATQELINAYTYLDDTTVILQNNNETEGQAMERIMQWDQADLMPYRQSIEGLLNTLYAQNGRVVKHLMTADISAERR